MEKDKNDDMLDKNIKYYDDNSNDLLKKYPHLKGMFVAVINGNIIMDEKTGAPLYNGSEDCFKDNIYLNYVKEDDTVTIRRLGEPQHIKIVRPRYRLV